MKKLQNLSEVQKLGALGIFLASLGYASIVALLASKFDLLATMTLCALLVAFGAITTGVIVGMVKDETLARVVRGARYTTNAIIAERDELSDLLENSRADLRDERARVRVLSAQVMSDTEQLESVTNGYRALNTENADNAKHIGALRDRVRALSAQVSERDAELALLREELADSLYREKNASGDLARLREINNGLQAEHRASITKSANYQIERNRAVNTVDELRTELESVESQLNDSHSRETELRAERDAEREISQARALKAEKLRAEVADLTERVEVLQESRNDWRTAYDKLRNGVTGYTHSASTAFALGTIDRAYEVDGETRYPVK